MASTENPRYLQLKSEYCRKFIEESKRRFKEGHNAGLGLAVKQTLGISISKATVARILGGNRGEYEKVKAISEYYEDLIDSGDWWDACEPYEADLLRSKYQIKTDRASLDSLVKHVRQLIRFSFEVFDESTNLDQSLWVRENFVELDMVEVSHLPSEYPALNREVLQNSEANIEDEFDRVGIKLLRGRRVSDSEILEKYRKIFVYGDPGSGKSSYLQSIALKCRDGIFLENYIPIFVEIRRYSASDNISTLMTFVEKMFEAWGISSQDSNAVLSAGRVLFLFDGLDEALEGKRSSIQFMLQEMLDSYGDCRFIFTSRLASIFSFRGVQKVIISPFFSKKQIPEFVHRWFAFHGSRPDVASSMLEKLKSPRYAGIREISRRPVLLNLLC